MSSSEHRPARRALLAALVAGAPLAACGFRPRGEATFKFGTVFVNAPGQAALATELRRALANSGPTTVVEDPAKADVIIDVLSVLGDKQVLSLSPGGRVQEYSLTSQLRFRVRDNAGREWLAPDDIVTRRTYTYDDSQRLAKEFEEQRLLREMQADAAAQIVRRLQAARPPA
jgi:LPS-assembly lipoprotein